MKVIISASQTIHSDLVNDTFRLQKQYVCEFLIPDYGISLI